MQINKSDFEIVTIDDEIRADGLCKGLLMEFYESLLTEGVDKATATRLANGADHFIRDFVVGVKMLNIFNERTGLIRQFAGNWYIVSTLEPSAAYLADALQGVARFFRFLTDKGLVSTEYCKQVAEECADISFYSSRIENFLGIKGDGYDEWEKLCTLRNTNAGAGEA